MILVRRTKSDKEGGVYFEAQIWYAIIIFSTTSASLPGIFGVKVQLI